MDIFHKITLNDGHQIPVIGMGTDRILDQEIMDSVVEEGPVKIYAQNCLQAPAE